MDLDDDKGTATARALETPVTSLGKLWTALDTKAKKKNKKEEFESSTCVCAKCSLS